MQIQYAKQLQQELSQELDNDLGTMPLVIAMLTTQAEIDGAKNMLTAFFRCHAQGMNFNEALQYVIHESSSIHHQAETLIKQASQIINLAATDNPTQTVN